MNGQTPPNAEKRWRSVIEKSLDGIVAVDGEGRICLVNEACAGLFGYTREELLGQDMDLLLPEALRAHHREVFERYRLTKEGQGVINRTVEFEAYDRYGSPLPIEIALADASFDDEFMVLATLRDLRARKHSELELKRFAAIVEQSAEDVIVTDAQGLILYVNPAFSLVTGYSAEEALGRNPRFLQSGQHSREFYEAMWATIRSGQVWAGRIVNRRKDGKLVEEDAILTPLLNEDGQITGYAAHKRDVSDQLRRLKYAQKLQKMEAVERLAGGLAHDFNNLLTGIGGYLEMALLISRELGQERLVALLSESKAGSVRAAKLTQKLLSFSRKQHLEPRLIDVVAWLRELTPRLVEILGDDYSLDFALAEEPLFAALDTGHVEPVICNLLGNARDAMPQGGTIRLACRAQSVERNDPAYLALAPGNYVMLSIADEGPGMSDEVMQHLFEPFFTTKPRGRGTGLGLATAYGTVAQHHGTILAKSETGRGAEFVVLLPRVSATRPDSVSAEPSPAAPVESGKGECVLLVEDDPIVLDIAERMLTQLGYRALSAASADQALRLAEREQGTIRLLFSDVVMPGMNGNELACVLSAKYPALKILLTSGYVNDVAFRQSPLKPGFAFLHKPYNLQTMAEKIRELLSN